MSEERAIECLISGRVTDVMFRDFVCRRARRLGLVGTVENTPIRQVRVLAQGDEASLRQLISYLNRGPLFSKVGKVETVWREPTSGFKSFKILY